MTLGNKIKKIRNYRGLTQKQLGKLTGIHEVSIRKYEMDKVIPKKGQLTKISSVLGVPLNTFYDYEIANNVDILPLLFAIDEVYPFSIKKNSDKYTLEFQEENLNNFLHGWMNLKEMLNDGFETYQNYELWKLLCPFYDFSYINVKDASKKIDNNL
ncbi:MAG: helix-turn-helix transcriptional regulator [Thomasclavelia sp.]